MTATNTFLWCSAHTPTQEQIKSLNGTILYLNDIAPQLMAQLTNTPSSRGDMKILAEQVLEVALEKNCTIVQLGGSPAFLYVAGATIKGQLSKTRIIFADSERVSEDKINADGSVTKISVFKHKGWI